MYPLRLSRPDEISGLGVGQAVSDQLSDYGSAGRYSPAHDGGAIPRSDLPAAAPLILVHTEEVTTLAWWAYRGDA